MGPCSGVPTERKGETLIVIAPFYHPEGIVDTEAHNEIRHAIETAAQYLGESSLRVAVSSVPIDANDQDRAEKLGKQYDADIVIWGTDTGVRVIANFLNLKHPDFDAAQAQISETQRTQIANPDAYAAFMTPRPADQLSFLSLFAIGQSYYLQGAYAESISAIEKGIAALAPSAHHPKAWPTLIFDLVGFIRRQRIISKRSKIHQGDRTRPTTRRRLQQPGPRGLRSGRPGRRHPRLRQGDRTRPAIRQHLHQPGHRPPRTG